MHIEESCPLEQVACYREENALRSFRFTTFILWSCGAKQKKLRWGLGYINNRSWARSHQSSRANLHIYRIIPGNAHDAHHCQNTLTFLSLGSFLLQTSRWNWQSSLSPSLVRHWLPPKMRPNQHQRGRTSPNKHQRGRMTVSKISRVGNRLMIVYHCDLRCFSMNDEQNTRGKILKGLWPSEMAYFTNRYLSIWHHMKAIAIPFHMRYGSMICSKGLQSGKPKCWGMLVEAGATQRAKK